MLRVFTSLTLASVLFGCAANSGDESFLIVGVLSPPDTGCQFTASAGGPFLSAGQADFLLNSSYFMEAQFESRIVAAEGKESLRRVDIQGANISLEIDDIFVTRDGVTTQIPAPPAAEYQVRFSSSLPPNGGLSLARIDVIPPDIVATITAAARVDAEDPTAVVQGLAVATITPFGDFYGDRLDGLSFQWPVTFTNANRHFNGSCPLAATFVAPTDSANGCSPLIDTVVQCCQDATAGPICPPLLAICGNNVCEAGSGGETTASCPADCP